MALCNLCSTRQAATHFINSLTYQDLHSYQVLNRKVRPVVLGEGQVIHWKSHYTAQSSEQNSKRTLRHHTHPHLWDSSNSWIWNTYPGWQNLANFPAEDLEFSLLFVLCVLSCHVLGADILMFYHMYVVMKKARSGKVPRRLDKRAWIL